MSEADLRWYDVADADEVWEGEVLDFEVGGEEVMVAHLLGGDLRAFQGMCPHQEISLLDGEWDADTSELTCGGHAWVFDLRTGKGVNPAGCQLFQYAVRVADDKIQVGVPQDGRRHYNRDTVNTTSAREESQ
ncbi:Rieske 2Fe-2S domain-containing protein [Mycobacterium sp. NBC_00419]|uniref:Rieske 2Fe-2S domain-containing protein n=1 Tax=Mycobacterium sp. NBC_00419 TaxID=2975989 RepID=UPI002E20311B